MCDKAYLAIVYAKNSIMDHIYDNQAMDPEDGMVSNKGVKKSDKEPMYKSAPEDNAPICRKKVMCTVGILLFICAAELIVIVMCLNGTIPQVNDKYYIRPPEVVSRIFATDS